MSDRLTATQLAVIERIAKPGDEVLISEIRAAWAERDNARAAKSLYGRRYQSLQQQVAELREALAEALLIAEQEATVAGAGRGQRKSILRLHAVLKATAPKEPAP
jgi:hypothetical protein